MKSYRFRTPQVGLAFLVGSLVCAGLVAGEKSSGWPQFRGPGGSGVSAETGLPTKWGQRENVVWKTELPGPGTSTPVIVGGKVFLTTNSGKASDPKRQVVCLDAKTGKVSWTQEVTSKLPEQQRIREDHGYASSTPVADGERVFVFFGKSGVFAFDHAGKQQWQADVGSKLNGWGSSASPVLYKDLVIVNASVESESLVALDRKTGKEKWQAGGIRESWATPLLVNLPDGKVELVVPIFGKILGFDPDTGKQLWSCDTGIGWYMVPSLVAHDGVVYCIGGRSGGALAVRAGGSGDVTETHRLWTGRKGSNVSSPVYHDGHLYWANDNSGTVYCAEAKTGKIIYEEKLNRAGQFYAAALLADGKIYYLDRLGRTYVVAASPKFELLAVNDLSHRATFNASPAAAGGRLFLRSDRYLFCLGRE